MHHSNQLVFILLLPHSVTTVCKQGILHQNSESAPSNDCSKFIALGIELRERAKQILSYLMFLAYISLELSDGR